MSEAANRVIRIIITQINLLLCLVNDILDLKLIEEKKFKPKLALFDPRETLDFIVDLFTA